MTRISLGIVALALLATSGRAEPDSVQARAAVVEATAKESLTVGPTPATPEGQRSASVTPRGIGSAGLDLAEPAPQPALELPATALVGEFIDASVLAPVPAGVTPNLQWKLNGQPADAKHVRLTADGLGAVLALPVGKHTVTVRGGWGVVVLGQVALTFIDLEGVIEVIGPQPPPVDPDNPDDPVTPPIDPATPATAAVYVYEKDDTAVPVGVTVGLNRLNREKKITATLYEDHTEDGDGDTPGQYKASLAAARQVGLPAFVVMAGDKVLNVVKAPTTEAEVWGAVP